MGLLEHLRGDGADEPGALLRDHPSVLLPTEATPEAVTALVARWSPLGETVESGDELAEGIRWYGPLDLTDELVAEASLQPGFATAYVAACRRTRILRSPASRRWRRWSSRFTDSRLGLDPRVTEQAAEDLEADFPGGLPIDVEARAWDLVRGVARGLGGVALLPEDRPYTPDPDEDPGAVVYSATALTPEEAQPLLAGVAPTLTEDPDEELTSRAGFWLLTSADGEFSVVADLVEGDERPPAVRDLGERLTAYDATARDDALEHAVAQRLAEATGGVVLDEFGFRR